MRKFRLDKNSLETLYTYEIINGAVVQTKGAKTQWFLN